MTMTQAVMDDIVFSTKSRPMIQLDRRTGTTLTIVVGRQRYFLRRGTLLGTGGGCLVYKYEGSGLKYAIRICDNDASEHEISEKILQLKEKYTVKQRLIDVKTCKYHDNEKTYGFVYIMECYEFDLNGYFKKFSANRGTKLRILNKVRKLVLGLAEKRLYYMDLKPENILCNTKMETRARSVRTARTIDIDSIVLGDVGSLSYGGKNTLICSYPPPESLTDGKPGHIYVDKHTPLALQKMLSYLMGIMIVALFKPDCREYFFYHAETVRKLVQQTNKSREKVRSELGNTYVHYLNTDVTIRKGLDVEITDNDLPFVIQVSPGVSTKKQKLGIKLRF